MRALLLVGFLLAAGCTSLPPEVDGTGSIAAAPTAGTEGRRVALTALQWLGVPYRYGGAGPQGFDCSGLVWYSYRQLGLRVPRTTAGLQAGSRPVPTDQLRPGDLLFFRLEGGSKVSHVGIYLGERRFVHAPSTGGRVSRARLDSEFWRPRLVGAGRL